MSRLKTPLSTQITDLLAKEHYVTVPQLVTLLTNTGNTYNKTSVYRALEKLVEQNKICKLNFGDNDIVYELRDSHHDHLVCTTCGSITAMPCEESNGKMINGFKVDHHHLTYFGMCQQCQQKN